MGDPARGKRDPFRDVGELEPVPPSTARSSTASTLATSSDTPVTDPSSSSASSHSSLARASSVRVGAGNVTARTAARWRSVRPSRATVSRRRPRGHSPRFETRAHLYSARMSSATGPRPFCPRRGTAQRASSRLETLQGALADAEATDPHARFRRGASYDGSLDCSSWRSGLGSVLRSWWQLLRSPAACGRR